MIKLVRLIMTNITLHIIQNFCYWVHLNLLMALYIRGNGTKEKDVVEVSTPGKMVRYMKGVGIMINQQEKEDLFTLMEMCMKETGWITRQRVLEFISILVGQGMKVNGLVIFNKVKV